MHLLNKSSIFLLFCCIGHSTSTFCQENWAIQKLPETINTPYDEINPVPSRDGKTIFFTRVGYPDFDRTLIFDTVHYHQKLDSVKYIQMLGRLYQELGQTALTEPWRSKFNQDVWFSATNTAGQFTNPTHPGYPLNNALTNSLVTLTPDPNAYYIINQFKPEGDMKRGFSVIRRQKDGSWSFPKPVTIKDYYTITSDVNLTMSLDGKVLILSAARFDSRDLDLYICFKEGEHQWSAPQHMGKSINSDRREMTPYLSENNRTLYFASDRGGTTGGLDIYMTRRETDSWFNWTTPEQLITPINSKSDESQPYFNMTTGNLYFTSKRAGSSDIYSVHIAPPQATELVITGRVINSKNNYTILDAQLNYHFEADATDTLTVSQGEYTLRVPKGVKVTISGSKPGFVSTPIEVYFKPDYYYFQDSYTFDIALTPLEAGDKIELSPIFFQQSKAIILEQSYSELTRLSELLQSNPQIHIRVEGHTDNNGKLDDLNQLSLDRANAVRDFLTAQGISTDRIRTEGHGPKRPLTDNSDDESRSKNRRVEVNITKISASE